MTGVFRQKNPGNVLVLFLLSVVLKAGGIWAAPAAIVREQDGVIYKWLVGLLQPVAAGIPSVYAFVAFLCIFLQAYFLTRFINNHRLMNRGNFLPGMAYILLTSFVKEFNYLSAPLLSSVFYLAAFAAVFKSHNQKMNRSDTYNSGFLVGIASMIFGPSTIFLVWIFIALVMLRPFRLNEWLLVLLGLATPYYFFIAIHFVIYGNLKGLAVLFKDVRFGLHKPPNSIWFATAIFLALAPLLPGIYYMQKLSGRMLIHVRKAWQLFLLYMFTAIVMAFFSPGTGMENWVMVLIPVAAIHGYGYFNAEVKIFPVISFWVSIVFIVALRLWG